MPRAPPAPVSERLSSNVTEGWKLKVCNSIAGSELSTSSDLVGWKEHVRTLHSAPESSAPPSSSSAPGGSQTAVSRRDRFSAATSLLTLLDGEGGPLLLGRLTSARRLRQRDALKGVKTVETFDAEGNVVESRVRSIKEMGRGATARSPFVDAATVLGEKRPTARKPEGYEVDEDEGPSKKDLLAGCGLSELRARSAQSAPVFGTGPAAGLEGVSRPTTTDDAPHASSAPAAAYDAKRSGAAPSSAPPRGRSGKAAPASVDASASANNRPQPIALLSPTTTAYRDRTRKLLSTMDTFAIKSPDASVSSPAPPPRKLAPSPIRSPAKAGLKEQRPEIGEESTNKPPKPPEPPAAAKAAMTSRTRLPKKKQQEQEQQQQPSAEDAPADPETERAATSLPAPKSVASLMRAACPASTVPVFQGLGDLPDGIPLPMIPSIVLRTPKFDSDTPQVRFLSYEAPDEVTDNSAYEAHCSLLVDTLHPSDIDLLLQEFISNKDLQRQKSWEFKGFKAPLAVFKSSASNAKGFGPLANSLKPLYTLNEIRVAINDIFHSKMENAVIQKFIHGGGRDPYVVRVVWTHFIVAAETSGSAEASAVASEKENSMVSAGHIMVNQEKWQTECVAFVVKSKYAYLANLSSHLELSFCLPSAVTVNYPSEEVQDLLVSCTQDIVRSLRASFGKNVRVTKIVLDFVRDASTGEFVVQNVLDLHCETVEDKRSKPGEQRDSSVPLWALERGQCGDGVAMANGGKGTAANRTGKLCPGDFCGAKNDISCDNQKVVLGRSLLKAKVEMYGFTPPASEYAPSSMNRSHFVCDLCYSSYSKLDAERLRKTREKMEADELDAEKEARDRRAAMVTKGWKSRVQIDYERKLAEEKGKIKALLARRQEQKEKMQEYQEAKAASMIRKSERNKAKAQKGENRGEIKETAQSKIEGSNTLIHDLSPRKNLNQNEDDSEEDSEDDAYSDDEDDDGSYGASRLPNSGVGFATAETIKSMADADRRRRETNNFVLNIKRRGSSIVNEEQQMKVAEKQAKANNSAFAKVLELLKNKPSFDLDASLDAVSESDEDESFEGEA